ncbi:unnamed protein product [Blepharisma stoltei]|uniref:Ubiquitin-activating enzyme E1 C-terminal domain-containing protein n=1 Tax=Blepharisma stoltei TaxID=1481888 RepID=A0AAU9ITJ0_9CILI|nr:unnamed protein product [Blepharisma stoltei]CAG9324193.1 unnamed protein product [Blepharisma stoltei]
MSSQDHLYSRSIAAIGMTTQKKLFTIRVLISGLRGVGLEIAKNLILAGLNTVTLHDDSIISLYDLGTNFYISESHINQNRAESVVSKLQELNPNVSVNIHKGEITQEVISQHSLVLLTESDGATLRRVNSICRELSPQVGFVSVEAWGVAGHIFVDFGDNFEVSDRNGTDLKSYLITNISKSNPGVVMIDEKQRQMLQNGEYVRFKEVEGMTPLNDGRERMVTYIDQHSFSIDEDTTEYPDYVKYGIVEEVRKPFHYDFRPYEVSIKNPEELKPFIQSDYSKENRPPHLHLAMLAIRKFQEVHGFLPEVHNEDHANLCVIYAREIREVSSQEFGIDAIDESIIKNVAKYARLQIPPVTSIFGGIAAQEVIKFTGKFTPIQQWFHIDWFELIQPTASIVDSRYHDLQAIIGEEGVNKLKSVNLFMVGSGALGCELLKLFALSGICCGSGELTVTDDDNIEVSNLTRQFLFNMTNVGQSKSECATRIAKIMNPEINVTALKNRVCPETENLFNDRFWGKLNAVFGAVDNVHARVYVDSKCVWYKKPLFESGTEGTKANSQVIIPFLTQTYSDIPQMSEEKIPECTLKSFPYAISHCIEWSREKLSDYFTSGPGELNKYLENPEAYMQKLRSMRNAAMQVTQLKQLKEYLELSKISSFDDCIAVARQKLNELFNEEIRSLLHQFPPDAKWSEGGDFWSGTRRLPEPCIFDTEKEDHIGFIEAYANLVAFNLNIPQNRDRNYIKEVVSKVQVREFVPRKVYIQLENSEDQQPQPTGETDIKLREELLSWTEGFSLENAKPMTPIAFEKDDDTNFHIDFIHTASNLRANNYKISTIERHKTKVIAGKIIPALATTTAVIAGIGVAEFIKYTLELELEKMRDSFMNLASPFILFPEPRPAIVIKSVEYDEILAAPKRAYNDGFTKWDDIVIDGPCTMGELVDTLKEKYKVSPLQIACGKFCLFNQYSRDNKDELLKREVYELYKEISGDKTEGKTSVGLILFAVSVEDKAQMMLPPLKYIFSH